MERSGTLDEYLSELQVQPEQGLTSTEAATRLAQYGANRLAGKPRPGFGKRLLGQLKEPLVYVLLIAGVITLAIGEYVDTAIILAVVALNAVIGLVQESRAEKAIEALQQMSAPHALVRRDGEIREIDAADVVVGDIVILDAGRYVPADLRLVTSASLQIEESALTGESVPADKQADGIAHASDAPLGDQTHMAFMSTLVTYGRGEGVVIGTGMQTEVGKIATILNEEEDGQTPLQKKLADLGKTLGLLAAGICVLIFIISAFQDRDLLEMFLTSISLAVAAIPEGLPAIVAIVLALGVTRMSKFNAIVKRLPAVETLGAVTIICSDKTGTLTQNKMTVTRWQAGKKSRSLANEQETGNELSKDERMLLETLVLCSDATYEQGQSTGDPTEVALLVLGEKFGIQRAVLEHTQPRIAENPFDSDRKRMATLHQGGSEAGYRVHVKGALDQLLPQCEYVLRDGERIRLDAAIKQEIMSEAEQYADEALRVLAAAYRDAEYALAAEEREQGLIFLGIVGMIDPPRLEVKDAIAEAKSAGITPVMITGDHKLTAFAIARELQIADNLDACVSGAELDGWSDGEFAERVQHYRVFARVSPEHKVRIVRAFKAAGQTVSMTGDGVNDAPSLKSADIGVAMGITGTDVSKGASDMILTDDNFTTIVRAVREGRTIYDNIKKTVIFLLSCNLGEVIAILVAVLFVWPIPLLPTQILWINLVTDTLPAIALGVDPGDKDVMRRKPRPGSESFFARGAGIRTLIGGLLIGAITLVAFAVGLQQHGYSLGDANIEEDALSHARTLAFVVLAVSQLFYALSLRSGGRAFNIRAMFANRFLLFAIAVGLILQWAVVSIPFLATAFKLQPLPAMNWLLVLLLSLLPLLVNECSKLVTRTKDSQA